MLKLTIDRVHIEKDARLTDYIDEKIGKLDRYLPRQARQSAHAEVRLKGGPGRGKKQVICEVVIHLPKEIITSNQTGASAESAVDMVEAKLRNQLKRYKDKQVLSRRRSIWRRVRRIE